MNSRKLPRASGRPARSGAARSGASTARLFATTVAALAIAAGPAVFGGEAVAQEVKGDARAAAAKVGACIGCHGIPGYRSSYPMVYSVPMIHGQPAKYIENSLAAYRSGDRSHPTMKAIAGSLSDQDIADLAAYYGKPVEKK